MRTPHFRLQILQRNKISAWETSKIIKWLTIKSTRIIIKMSKALVRHFPLLCLPLKNYSFRMRFNLQAILFCKANRKYNIKISLHLKQIMGYFKTSLLQIKTIRLQIKKMQILFMLIEISMKMIFNKMKIQK